MYGFITSHWSPKLYYRIASTDKRKMKKGQFHPKFYDFKLFTTYFSESLLSLYAILIIVPGLNSKSLQLNNMNLCNIKTL